MDRKAVKRKSEREAVREANKRSRDAEMLLESNYRRNRDRRLESGNESETDEEGTDQSEIGIVNDNNLHGGQEDEQERNINESYHGNSDNDSVNDSDQDILTNDEDSDCESPGSNNEDDEPQAFLDPGQYVRQEILEWTLSGGISMAKVDDLLKRLKPVHQNLPLSYKTLLKTPRKVDIVDCGNGSLWYCGITSQLHRILTQEYLTSYNEIAIDINIDSVPLFNKSSTNFVPILGRLVGENHPFVIDKRYNFRIRHYILDQKARASIKCVKGVRGYFCCEKCTVRGTDYKNRMCLLNHNCALRTDESFIDLVADLMVPKTKHFDDKEIDSHVNGVSPLLRCETKLVSKFRLDSMHLVYKGVFSRWLEFLWSGYGNYSLSLREKREISSLLESFRKWCPCDFNRKPFAIKSEKLKAAELRRILLYDGLVAFKKLDKNVLKNFLLLHVSIYILCSPVFFRELNDEADTFLRAFVTHSKSLFGEEFIVYNVHSLVHLSSECLEHGPLDSFGAFPYENFLGMIKSRITSRAKPLQQIAKREMEKMEKKEEIVKPEPPLLQMPCFNDPHEPVAGQQYKKILVKKSVLSIKLADSCCALNDGTVVRISNIIDSENGPVLVGKKFAEMADYYEYPIASSLLDIYKVSRLQECTFYLTPADIKHKCYLLPLKEDEYVCYAVVEFKDSTCEVVPTNWLDEEDGELVSYYPPDEWSDARLRKAVENRDGREGLELHKNVRVLHTYNSILVARANRKVAEDTSNLDSEFEDLNEPRRKRRRIVSQIEDSEDEDEQNIRSKHPPPPNFLKSVEGNIKEKLEKLSAKKKDKTKKRSQFNSPGSSPLNLSPLKSVGERDGNKSKNKKKSPVTRPEALSANSTTLSRSQIDPPSRRGLHSAFSSPTWSQLNKSTDLMELCPGDLLASEITEGDGPLVLDTPQNFTESTPSSSSLVIGRSKVSLRPISQAEHMTIISVQVDIKNRLDAMERMLCSILRALKPSQKVVMPKELPPLPLTTLDQFDKNEVFLSNSADRSDTTEYLSKCVPEHLSVKDQVYNIFRKTMSDTLAAHFNWKGRGKKTFSTTNLCAVVTGAILDVNKKNSNVIGEAETAMKEWLKYAPKRAATKTKKDCESSSSSPTDEGDIS
ncbi:Flagellar biosynthetic protein FlhB [Frankliniella fusca]|uniref:Flagellar biosynthetic protein FlhB n=1 Tax=Frankliniella fusca TaxID=407009 RepID=A0AAE1GXP9_9NEOP|nr:Flagellar biosynthetic protein FlhB [Frankliniella fusca]